jgi:hypothetical protein
VGQRGHGKSRGVYFDLYGKGNENNRLVTGLFIHHRLVLAVMSVAFVSDTMSYVVPRGR